MGCAGRALKLCWLDKGAMVSTRQKAMASISSAAAMTDAASQTELKGNVLPPRCPDAGRAAVTTPVGSVPR